MTWSLALALAALTLAAPEPRDECGPRVTLVGTGIPLNDALERIGRQINRFFVGNLLQQPAGQRPYDFDLRGATVSETLAAVEGTVGYQVRRRNRGSYSIIGQKPVGQVGQRVGDFRVWLSMVQYYFYSMVSAAGGGTFQRGYLLPQITIEAPSDPEALRLRSVAPPVGLAPNGQELLPTRGRGRLAQPSGNEPNQWLVNEYLQAPEAGTADAVAVFLDLTFAAALSRYAFDFRLDTAEPQLQTDGDYDARLEPVPRAVDWRRGVDVELTGPPPPDGAQGNPQQALNRQVWVEGRLFAEAEPLYTETALVTVAAAEPTWTSTWRFALAPPDLRLKPTRLELAVAAAEGTGDTRRVTFDHVAIPTRFEEEPPAGGR